VANLIAVIWKERCSHAVTGDLAAKLGLAREIKIDTLPLNWRHVGNGSRPTARLDARCGFHADSLALG
jgi:hypothetical protein